ncbi:MAG: hypothetical protein U9R51_00525 [Actinomycetota bacterium]|nr:hypothetical protein [Actinomycetota bacterium]
MLRRMSCVLAVVCLIATACSQDDSATNETVDPSTTATLVTTTTTVPTTVTQPAFAVGCDEPLAASGEYEGLSVVDGVERSYWVVVPESYADVTPAPLFVWFASGGGDDDYFLGGWRPYLSDLPGLMVIVNMTRGPSPDELTGIIDQLTAEYCIDTTRIHALGESSSEGAVISLACEESDRIASFVAALGSSTPSETCNPERPVPLLSFTGDVDRAGVTALVERWVELNGCDPEPFVEDLGSGVVRKTYQSCEADVVFYDIEGMGHHWPMHEAKGPGAGYVAVYEEVDYLEEALKFFEEHPLP